MRVSAPGFARAVCPRVLAENKAHNSQTTAGRWPFLAPSRPPPGEAQLGWHAQASPAKKAKSLLTNTAESVTMNRQRGWHHHFRRPSTPCLNRCGSWSMWWASQTRGKPRVFLCFKLHFLWSFSHLPKRSDRRSPDRARPAPPPDRQASLSAHRAPGSA